MNKTELVAKVLELLGKEKETTAADANRAVTATLDAIAAGIKKDQLVQVIGFGTFQVVSVPARTGTNPSTGAKIKLKATKRLKFKVGATLKEAVAKLKTPAAAKQK